MSGSTTDTKNAKHTDNRQRWAALDKRHERLFDPSDRALTDTGKDNNLELKAAS